MSNSSIRLIDQVVPLQARVDLGAMAMKGYSTFPKCPIQDTCCGERLTPLQRLVYSISPADWAKKKVKRHIK